MFETSYMTWRHSVYVGKINNSLAIFSMQNMEDSWRLWRKISLVSGSLMDPWLGEYYRSLVNIWPESGTSRLMLAGSMEAWLDRGKYGWTRTIPPKFSCFGISARAWRIMLVNFQTYLSSLPIFRNSMSLFCRRDYDLSRELKY